MCYFQNVFLGKCLGVKYKALKMKRCPQCGIERTSFDSPCQICGYGGDGKKESSDSIPRNTDTKSCPFCGEEIRLTAIKCKHCGEFIGEKNEKSSTGNKVQTIELTSKKYKLQMLLSTLLTFVSLFFMFNGCVRVDSGLEGHVAIWVFGFFAGLIWFCLVRFQIWWHHS